MSEGKVRRWCRKFKGDHTNEHDKELSGNSNIQTDKIVQQVDQTLRFDRRLTIMILTQEFPHIRYITVVMEKALISPILCKMDTESAFRPT